MTKKSHTSENIEDETNPTPEEAEDNEEQASAEEVEEVETEASPEELLKKKEGELDELRNEMLRLRADVENVRRRLNKEKQESIAFANEKLIRELIPVYDNLERALKAPDASIESIKEGVAMTAKQFQAIFEKQNVEAIPAVGEKFDPAVHEVLTQIESHEHEENTVVEEYVRGYKMNGRVLLPAKVATAKKPAKGKQGDGDSDDSGEAQASA